MIKIIIAANNDILYDSLSNIALQNETKIELINVPMNQLSSLVYKMSKKQNLIILDVYTSVSLCVNILKNMSNRLGKDYIILVVDSKQMTNIVNHEKTNFFLKKQTNISTILEIISDSVKDAIKLEQKVDDILWKLGFPTSFKSTKYLKDAILLAYNNNYFLQDTYSLVKEIAIRNNMPNEKSIRSDIDKSINSILDYTRNEILYAIFGDDYDGRKVSFKYFMDLCIRYLNKQRYCCLEH